MSSITITILGCSDAFGSGARNNTCFYVNASRLNFLIDCGVSSLTALKANRLTTNDVDLIIFSHFHGDHFGGLPFVILDAARLERKKPLTIISPRGGKQRLSELLEMLYPGTGKTVDKLELKFIEFNGNETVFLDSIAVESFPVIHVKETLPHGLRITVDDKIIAFSGDTEWTDKLADIAKDADLFICECTFYQTEKKGHLSYKQLMSRIPELQFKRMLLTHFDDEMIQVIDELPEECADDGMRIILN